MRAISHEVIRSKLSPIISQAETFLIPVSYNTLAGTIVSMYGRIWTNRVGSNQAKSPKGREERITRFYFGPNPCELIKDPVTFEPYGVKLNSERSDWGTIKCKLQGEFVGLYNASFLVEGE